MQYIAHVTIALASCLQVALAVEQQIQSADFNTCLPHTAGSTLIYNATPLRTKNSHLATTSLPVHCAWLAEALPSHSPLPGVMATAITASSNVPEQTPDPCNKWTSEDAHGHLQVLADGLALLYPISGQPRSLERELEGYAARADRPMEPQRAICYFEITILAAKQSE